jgi:hypothetical protein
MVQTTVFAWLVRSLLDTSQPALRITSAWPRRSSPSCPSPTPTFALAKGTSGAQHATPNPAAKNERRDALAVGAP